LRVDASGSGVEARDGIVGVVLAGEEVRQLEAVEVLLQILELRAELPRQLRVVFRGEQLVGDLDVL
jgi:hypothetical protein